MKRGFITLMALKIISEKGPITGYQISKHIGEITGRIPSSGTIYPMLKLLEEKGFISGKAEGNKINYTITKKGKEYMGEQDNLRTYFLQKMSEHIAILDKSLVKDFISKMKDMPFAENSNKNWHVIFGVVFNLFNHVKCALRDGVPAEQISGVLNKAREEINKLIEKYKKEKVDGDNCDETEG